MNVPAAELTVLRAPGFGCVQIVGRATFACSPGFKSVMEDIISTHPMRLILDLDQCQLMDSTFLGVLVGAAEKFLQTSSTARTIELHNANERITGLIASLGVASLFQYHHGSLELPPDVRERRLSIPDPTKIQLKETSLAAHHRLMQISPANQGKFAELTRTLKEDLDRLKAGEPPSLPGFDMAVRIEQAGVVGGDFYDFAPRAGLRAGVLIADVSGKGSGAAQIAALCRPILHGQLATERAPAIVFREVLPVLVPQLPEGMFVTAMCLVLDSVTRSFRMARAGHDPLLWFHAQTGTVEMLSPKGMAIGIERAGLLDATFVEKEHQIAPGDVLLLHTDGITESLSPAGAEFGCARLMELLKASATLNAKGIVEKVFATLTEFTQAAAQQDDRTLVIIKAV